VADGIWDDFLFTRKLLERGCKSVEPSMHVLPYASSRVSSHFRHGDFLGDYVSRRDVAGIALAEMTPTVPAHDVHTHTHDEAHLLLLLEGNYLSSAAQMPKVCTQRALLLNPPGTTHRDCFEKLAGRFLTISLSPAQWQLANEQRSLPIHAQRLNYLSLVRAHKIWQELRQWDKYSALALECEVHNILHDLHGPANLHGGPAWMTRVYEQLADQAQTSPDLATLARTADVHPVHLARAFQRRFGLAPAEFLRARRLERACDQLTRGTRGVLDIALDCAFVDHSHFTHAFKRAFAITPKHYRQLLNRHQ
jgi:AraC family transcriptional regulator